MDEKQSLKLSRELVWIEQFTRGDPSELKDHIVDLSTETHEYRISVFGRSNDKNNLFLRFDGEETWIFTPQLDE